MNKFVFCLIFLTLINLLAAQGNFNIDTFTDPRKYGWSNWEDRMNYRYDLNERQKLLQIYEIDAQSISGNVLKSAIFPGWGQFNARQYTKGQILMALEIGFIGASYFFYDRAMYNYDKYREATNIVDINQYYNDAKVPYQYSVVFFTLASVVWIYNLFDVIQTTEK